MNHESKNSLLRKLPQVDELIRHPHIEAYLACLSRELLTQEIRSCLSMLRNKILSGETPCLEIGEIASLAEQRITSLLNPSLKKVINASGVIIHTNLGRSPLAPEAIDAVVAVASGYSNLEYNLDTLERGSRHAHCEALICALTGAEAAIAVNNNAAAVFMVLTEFSADREAIVSRGELVEIGGSFRIPDIMKFSHAHMIEVGTTNKTHLNDYEHALSDETSLLLKVHPSNYRLVGFTESVAIRDLKNLAEQVNSERKAKHNATENTPVLVYEDQGSGAFTPLDCFGEYTEPTIAHSLAQGCDLISFSGDKLLGGPQAGIIVGKREYIDRLKNSPLARVLRLDKMTLAALEATLRLYLDPSTASEKIPTLHMLTCPPETVKKRAEQLGDIFTEKIKPSDAVFEIVPDTSYAGGGALPLCDIETSVVVMHFKTGTALACERFLSTWPTPIVARIKNECLMFDARTILFENEMEEIAAAASEYFERHVPLSSGEES